MKRIFQHYKGRVDEFSGKSISSFFSVNDETDSNVYLLWMEVEDTKLWYRIFIDGFYCGIDEYRKCCIKDDLDDNLIVVDHISRLSSKLIKSAFVIDSDGTNRHIVLILKFSDQNVELICESEGGKNILKF